MFDDIPASDGPLAGLCAHVSSDLALGLKVTPITIQHYNVTPLCYLCVCVTKCKETMVLLPQFLFWTKKLATNTRPCKTIAIVDDGGLTANHQKHDDMYTNKRA